MIIDINQQTITEIKNPTFAAYANIYVDIYKQFMAQFDGVGIELDPTRHSMIILCTTSAISSANWRQVHLAGQKIKHLALTGGEPLLHSLFEQRPDGQYLRELKVDLTYPASFNREQDI